MAKSYKAIYGALVANILIAITKFIAGFITRSSSMIAEGVHSSVDTLNEVFLLYGIKRSRRPPDLQRPFGYGRELYFWSFVVSLMIFGLGGGISLYQGVLHIIHPVPMRKPVYNYVVLALSMLFEGASLAIAMKEFGKTKGDQSWWRAIVNSKDPSSFLVLLEDGAAVLGLLVVLFFTIAEEQLHAPFLDGVATCIVGLVLVAVSLVLARESRSLLMGEGVSSFSRSQIVKIAERDPAVEKVLHVLSSYQSPDEVLLMLIIAFKKDLETAEIIDAIERIRDNVQKQFKLIRFIIVQPDEYKQGMVTSHYT